MATRIISSLIGFPILAAVIAVGGMPMKLLMMSLSLIGIREFYNALSSYTDGNSNVPIRPGGTKGCKGRIGTSALPSMYHKSVHLVGYFFTIVYYMMLDHFETEYLMVLFALFLISVLIFLVFNFKNTTILDCTITCFGFFYVALLMSFIYLIRSHPYGAYIVWLVFICAWGCDTFAYFTGITMGKHKLTPELSPKKTVEGAVGGTLGATALAVAYSLVLGKIFNSFGDNHIVLFCAVAGCIGAISSQFGDLAASAIKRYTGIKDYGNIIPGHGGVLDRFDSVLFTAPGVYLVTLVLFNS